MGISPLCSQCFFLPLHRSINQTLFYHALQTAFYPVTLPTRQQREHQGADPQHRRSRHLPRHGHRGQGQGCHPQAEHILPRQPDNPRCLNKHLIK